MENPATHWPWAFLRRPPAAAIPLITEPSVFNMVKPIGGGRQLELGRACSWNWKCRWLRVDANWNSCALAIARRAVITAGGRMPSKISLFLDFQMTQMVNRKIVADWRLRFVASLLLVAPDLIHAGPARLKKSPSTPNSFQTSLAYGQSRRI